MVKNTPANAGDIREMGLIPASGRFPGEGNGNPLQYSCQENPMDRGAWPCLSPWGWERVRNDLATKCMNVHVHTHSGIWWWWW